MYYKTNRVVLFHIDVDIDVGVDADVHVDVDADVHVDVGVYIKTIREIHFN